MEVCRSKDIQVCNVISKTDGYFLAFGSVFHSCGWVVENYTKTSTEANFSLNTLNQMQTFKGEVTIMRMQGIFTIYDPRFWQCLEILAKNL